MDEYATECNAAAQAENWCPPPMPMGALLGETRPMSEAEYEKRNRDSRCQQAIYVLNAAREIRSNSALMAEVRQYLREERDRLAVLLDDVS